MCPICFNCNGFSIHSNTNSIMLNVLEMTSGANTIRCKAEQNHISHLQNGTQIKPSIILCHKFVFIFSYIAWNAKSFCVFIIRSMFVRLFILPWIWIAFIYYNNDTWPPQYYGSIRLLAIRDNEFIIFQPLIMRNTTIERLLLIESFMKIINRSCFFNQINDINYVDLFPPFASLPIKAPQNVI